MVPTSHPIPIPSPSPSPSHHPPIVEDYGRVARDSLQSSMGGGTIMHATNHPVPKFMDTLDKLSSSSAPNLKPPPSTINTLSCSVCHNQLCTKQPVPSQREVEDAVSALQEFMQAVSSSSTLQQILGSYGETTVMSQGYQRLYDAFQLLQADPAIKVSS
ncbi:hypothetical protein CR513_19164, partial [Mucuna pruriens]